MDSFAFITHPKHEQEFKESFFAARFIPSFFISKFMKVCPPLRLIDVKGVASKYNRVSGWVISSPLLSGTIKNNEPHAIKKALAACRFARKLGAKFIGLGGEFCFVEGLDELIATEMSIPVTTGSSYKIYALIGGLKMVAATKGLDLDRANVLITGAACNVGRVCAGMVANEVQKLTLIDRNKPQVEKIAKQILYDSGLVVKIGDDIEASVKEADVIIAADEDLPEFDNGCFKSGTIVFDIFSTRKGLSKTAGNRNDVMAIKKICTEVAGGADFNKNIGLPKDMVDSVMGEVLLLSLEKRYSPLTSSQTIKNLQVNDIGKLAERHGFRVSGFLTNASEEGIKSSVPGKIIIPGTA